MGMGMGAGRCRRHRRGHHHCWRDRCFPATWLCGVSRLRAAGIWARLLLGVPAGLRSLGPRRRLYGPPGASLPRLCTTSLRVVPDASLNGSPRGGVQPPIGARIRQPERACRLTEAFLLGVSTLHAARSARAADAHLGRTCCACLQRGSRRRGSFRAQLDRRNDDRTKALGKCERALAPRRLVAEKDQQCASQGRRISSSPKISAPLLPATGRTAIELTAMNASHRQRPFASGRVLSA
jgi:hypothetical protein